MFRIVAAAAFAASLASSANAQLTAESVMPSFNFQFVEPTLQAAGIPYKRVNINQNFSVLEITAPNGATFLAAPMACLNGMCAGFLLEKAIDRALSADQMMALNSSNNTVKVSRPTNSSKTFISRYLIGDYGYVRGSFLVNLNVFAGSVKKIEGEVAAGAVSGVSYDAAPPLLPSAPVAPGVKIVGDDFADRLNGRQKSVLISGEAASLLATPPADPSSEEHSVGAPLLSDSFVAGTVNRFD